MIEKLFFSSIETFNNKHATLSIKDMGIAPVYRIISSDDYVCKWVEEGNVILCDDNVDEDASVCTHP